MQKVRQGDKFPDLFKKALCEVKASGLQLSSYILIALSLEYIKGKPYKTLDYQFRDILNFYFLEKHLGIVSSPHFLYDFSTKMFLMMLCSIN